MKKEIKAVGNINVAGVYKITDIQGIILYIGSSCECGDAKSRHKHALSRGLYAKGNKKKMQDEFDNNGLLFEVIKISASNSDVAKMKSEHKKALQKALEVLEQFYIDTYKGSGTLCNKMKTVKKWSTSPTAKTTEARRKSNQGSNNPNCSKFIEEDIKQIKQLIKDGLSNKEIADRFDATATYISAIRGGHKWASVEIA